jgi:hypothetical protein
MRIYLHDDMSLYLAGSNVIWYEGTIGANTGEHRRFGGIEANPCYGLCRGGECDIHHGALLKDGERGKM